MQKMDHCRRLPTALLPYVDDREIEVNVAASFDRLLTQGIGSIPR